MTAKRLTFLCLLCGLILFGSGLWISAKAALAQTLLERAWSKSVQTGTQVTPWPSMDARPVMRLTVPALDASAIIFDRASGQALAFGPGHLAETAIPGDAGTAVIAAHKNTHFAFLQIMKPDMEIMVETAKGKQLTYRVSGTQIYDSDTDDLVISSASTAASNLALVTCYPFDRVSFGGPLRYVVWAESVTENHPNVGVTALRLGGEWSEPNPLKRKSRLVPLPI